MAMRNSSDTIGNRTRDLLTCSAVPQPTAPPRTYTNTVRWNILKWMSEHSVWDEGIHLLPGEGTNGFIVQHLATNVGNVISPAFFVPPSCFSSFSTLNTHFQCSARRMWRKPFQWNPLKNSIIQSMQRLYENRTRTGTETYQKLSQGALLCYGKRVD